MKTKYLLLGIVALLAAGGAWVGRAAWRAHRQLVSLDVRNAPLAEVLRKIERQTWTKIRAEKSVANARVILHVKDKPLSEVLDNLAEQAGARWSKLYAVYDSSRALKALDSALRGDGKLEPAGWIKLAPDLSDFDKLPTAPPPGANEDGPHLETGPGNEGGPYFEAGPGAGAPARVVHLEGAGAGSSIGGSMSGGPGGGGRMIQMRRGPSGQVVVQGGANGQMETWSPEELVMESKLRPRLGDDAATRDNAATPAAAAKTARKVDGRWTTVLAFRKSSLGVGFGLRTGAPPRLSGRGPNPAELGQLPTPPNPNKRFTTLTPEQRAQRERERRGVSEK